MLKGDRDNDTILSHSVEMGKVVVFDRETESTKLLSCDLERCKELISFA